MLVDSDFFARCIYSLYFTHYALTKRTRNFPRKYTQVAEKPISSLPA